MLKGTNKMAMIKTDNSPKIMPKMLKVLDFSLMMTVCALEEIVLMD